MSIDNRRLGMRIPEQRKVYCNQKLATMLNLSITGARLVTTSEDDLLALKFRLGEYTLDLEAQVVWRQRCGHSNIIGIRWLELSRTQLRIVQNHVLSTHYKLYHAA